MIRQKMKTAPLRGSHVFLLIGIICELFHDDWAKNSCYSTDRNHFLNSHIKETCVLTKFHENWAKNVTSRVFTYINKTNVLTNFHDDWAKIVTSRVKTAPPTGGHVFQRTGTTFELNHHIIKTNKLLTKFHEDRTINVASRVFMNKCERTEGRTDDGQRTVTKAHLSNQIKAIISMRQDKNNYKNNDEGMVIQFPSLIIINERKVSHVL
ncbi:hypothetical protein DPMN_110165 [Dreissena polymorpha]|uniref:Uncharacterized protein n=1 Tax=Dreissena polymorpha TaxID=45954 RepID=A0A9D4QNR2_DREPO|nr:hypothetical protein DPMN_110165 [Dreissena polymorpha]